MSKKQSISDFFSKVPKSSGSKQKSNDVVIASCVIDHDTSDSDENQNPSEVTSVELEGSPVVSVSAQEEDVTVVSSSSFSGSTTSSRYLDLNDLNMNSPSQPILSTYPKSKFGSRERPWLEYSVEKDACFCYPCRVFGVNVTSNTFTETGYRDWKHAVDSNSDTAKEKNKKGFAKHVASTQHS